MSYITFFFLVSAYSYFMVPNYFVQTVGHLFSSCDYIYFSDLLAYFQSETHKYKETKILEVHWNYTRKKVLKNFIDCASRSIYHYLNTWPILFNYTHKNLHIHII